MAGFGKVVRFQPRRDLIKREVAVKVAEQLRLFSDSDVPQHAREAMLNALQRLTSPDGEGSIWEGGFMMLSRLQTKAVWDAIRKLPSEARPHQVRHAFDLVLLNLRQDTGEVTLGTEDLVKELETAPENVSRVMGTLERMGVIRRERRRVPGVRGPGKAVFFINPHVAWNGSLNIRKDEAADRSPPLLSLLEGGASVK